MEYLYIKMNHNLASNMLTDISFENFLFFQMQTFLRFIQESANMSQQESTSLINMTPSQTKFGARSKAWLAEEDEILLTTVKDKGPKNWSKIAKQINYEIHNGSQLRKGKHCRERWFNHLNPDLNSMSYLENEWTSQEDEVLLKLHKVNGNSWSLIARSIVGRTENSVRNRWNILNKLKTKQLIKD